MEVLSVALEQLALSRMQYVETAGNDLQTPSLSLRSPKPEVGKQSRPGSLMVEHINSTNDSNKGIVALRFPEIYHFLFPSFS